MEDKNKELGNKSKSKFRGRWGIHLRERKQSGSYTKWRNFKHSSDQNNLVTQPKEN